MPPLVTTVPELCRTCYTCVRECPAKAIRIEGGQAEVVPERCIGCGNCVRVCSQNAKQPMRTRDDVAALLEGPGRVAACIAPSFPAEFPGLPYERLVGMLRALGFDIVSEVAYGADLVTQAYRELFTVDPDGRFIGTSCPAVVAYVERYAPTVVKNLAPIVSPMIASARALRRLYGDDLRIVFIGPCIAKLGESADVGDGKDVDAGLTFLGLRRLFERYGVTEDSSEDSEFDEPWSDLGALFPLSRGMLQAAGIQEDLIEGEVVAADGRGAFVEAIKEFESGELDAKFLDLLCCNGCIMGAGMTTDEPQFRRRSRISQHVRQAQKTRTSTLDAGELWEALGDLDLERTFTDKDRRIPVADLEAIEDILTRMGKLGPQDELNCGACGYESCREHALAIQKGLAESEMCLPYTIERLNRTVQELGASNDQLAQAQEALMHSERLASMGQLAAGIAHEVNNPLGVVLMYAHILLDEAGADAPLRDDLTMIVEQADRCKKIVSGLLNFARQNKVQPAATNLPDLAESIARSLGSPPGITIRVETEDPELDADIDKDQIAQVLSNLAKNACDAMPNGGELVIRTSGDEDDARFTVRDTGSGIPDDVRKKVFEPFFTTKGVGKGTGLGLSVSYGIVKMHRGDIHFETNSDPSAGPTGTTFNVTLPRRRRESGLPKPETDATI